MYYQRAVRIVEQVALAERTWRLRLDCPEIAAAIRPGQFVMLRLPGTNDPLLGRPFALYDTVEDAAGVPVAIDIVYLVVGRLTGRLAELPAGAALEVWGPLGRPLPALPGEEQAVCVAGGIGQTPFLAYARWLLGQRHYGGMTHGSPLRRVVLYYGVRTAARAAGVADFAAAGVDVRLCSDDGSVGRRGLVTACLADDRPDGTLIGCGPEAMLRALAALARQWSRRCYVSLETPMACGVGICYSCVTPVRTVSGWDYVRVCVDGPIFDAAVWCPEALAPAAGDPA